MTPRRRRLSGMSAPGGRPRRPRAAEGSGKEDLGIAARVRVEADGIAVQARKAIVALPPRLVSRLDFDPPLPADRQG